MKPLKPYASILLVAQGQEILYNWITLQVTARLSEKPLAPLQAVYGLIVLFYLRRVGGKYKWQIF